VSKGCGLGTLMPDRPEVQLMRFLRYTLLAIALVVGLVWVQPVEAQQQNCDPAYTGVCIAPPPPDLDCGEISARNFRVYRSSDSDRPAGITSFDPHRFDGDNDGIGCESQR
jgi:Excalibur calcium-binding domain